MSPDTTPLTLHPNPQAYCCYLLVYLFSDAIILVESVPTPQLHPLQYKASDSAP